MLVKLFSRLLSALLLVCIVFQSAFAEEQIMTTRTYYESSKHFSTQSNAIVNMHSTEPIGDIMINGDELTLSENSAMDVPVYIVSSGKSVQFSIVNIKNYVQNRSDFSWKLAEDGASRIDHFDWKRKIGFGGILVQTSIDNKNWDTVYTNTNVFKAYRTSIKNFYSAKRSDLNAGCYYRVIIAYKMTRKTKQQTFLFIDTSSWENRWNVDEYSFFLIADEASVTSVNIDYAPIVIGDDPNTGVVGSVFGNASTSNRVAGEEIFTGPTGHGFAAEAANIQDAAIHGILNGDKVTHTGANNVKDGSDYIITSADGIVTEIQSKYYSTPSGTVNACFNEQGYFRYYSESGVPMAIEVPSDQYDKALILLQNKIKQGLVPGVTDPADAEKILRKGTVTYKQAVNIAKAGNIDSLKYDAKNSCVSAASAFGVSAVVTFASSVWSHDPVDVALQKSLYAGIKVGGNAFVTSILSSQLSKAGLNSLLVPGSEAVIRAIGPKASAVIINAARIGAKPIYGAAAMKSAAKLLRSNTITATISLAIFTVPDVIDTFRGRISGKQLVKNLAETAGGIGGGMAGAAGGAAGGAAIGSIIPGVGTAIGATVGGIIGALGGGAGGSLGVGAIADLIAEDDADEMLDIITVEFQNLAEEYLLNNDEATHVSDALQKQLDGNTLKDMYASSNQHVFARSIVEKLILAEIKKRAAISVPSDQELASTMVTVLEQIYDEADLEAPKADTSESQKDKTTLEESKQDDRTHLVNYVYDAFFDLTEEYTLTREQIQHVEDAIPQQITEEVLHDLETVDNPRIYARLLVKSLINMELNDFGQ